MLQKKRFAIGKIERYQGNLRQAQQFLDAKFSGTDLVTGRNFVCHLAGVICELKQSNRAEKLLVKELITMKRLGFQEYPGGRRLQLSLAETLLQQSRLKEAEDTYLGPVIEKDCPNPTIDTKVEKLRLWVGVPRVYQLDRLWLKALKIWKKALRASWVCG